MKTIFHGKRITGILGVVPETISLFDDEIGNYNFPASQTLRLKKVMGYKQHRLAKYTTSASDLCNAGLDYILSQNWLTKDEIGGIVVATPFPDHFIPPVSSLIHGKFQLDSEVFCVDMSQGCTGFVVALNEAFMLLDHVEKGKKVLVFSSEVLSKKVSKQDRNSYPLIGDAAGIAVAVNDDNAPDIFSIVRNRGDLDGVLTIPAGGSRLPSSPETARMYDTAGDGNIRSLDNLVMKGADVFTFAQTEVPPLIDDLMSFSGLGKDNIDLLLMHQPNRFMVRKLAEKIGLPYEKVPSNLVENFGNSGGACIPMNITLNFPDLMKEKISRCVLCAFGSGLTLGAMTMELGKLDFCKMLETDL